MKKTNPIYPVLEGILLCCFGFFLYTLLHQTPVTTKTIEELQTAVVTAMPDENVQDAGTQDIKRVFGLESTEFDGVVYRKPILEMDVCELLLVKLKDSSQTEAVEAAVQNRLAIQKNNFDGYGTNQTSLLENAIVHTEGGCVLYVVSANPQAVLEAFRQAL